MFYIDNSKENYFRKEWYMKAVNAVMVLKHSNLIQSVLWVSDIQVPVFLGYMPHYRLS